MFVSEATEEVAFDSFGIVEEEGVELVSGGEGGYDCGEVGEDAIV